MKHVPYEWKCSIGPFSKKKFCAEFAKSTEKVKKSKIFLNFQKIPTTKVLMLEHPTWSHSTGNIPENFLGLFGGFGE